MPFGRFGSEDSELLEKEELHRGFLTVERHSARYRRFAGGWIEQLREIIDQHQSAAVLPYDPERDCVVLIEQFRLPALLAGKPPWQIEVVAGLLDQEGEAAEAVIRREAEEEAGVTITDLEPVAALMSSPGSSTEVIHHFIGRTDASDVGGLHGLEIEQEDIRAEALPFEEAWALLEAGRITNAPAWTCLTGLKLKRDGLRERWRRD
ncbi:NUDIX domain-containing protein [Aquibaculum arenosum]|uniref:ADP-ribose pyrophosphatase n=1 Tax=Aquibaculum arenosum TaxID=3032591 RepID=A0ABT5YLL7_9PROT|nr:NUDIX domain-containing protein [Fodinicurvata sp. CAU 1616]MDF2095851.1 NUDIX domain-containing protein [Fodinicurvata sp. CAU 1616]